MRNITIDGPSGSGKSTVAKSLSKKLGIMYLDTGAMYRGMGYFALKNNIDPADEKAVLSILKNVSMEIIYADGEQRVLVNGEDVTPFIREHPISMAASTISKIPAVRMKLVELQRKIARNNDCVLDGRDIGSFVLSDAQHKFYLTATAAERADRRYKELMEKGQSVTYEDVLADIEKRDFQDKNRDFAPLVIPEGAVVLDTTGMSAEEVLDTILGYLW